MSSGSGGAVLAVDLGTGSVKAVAFSAEGLEVLGRASVPVAVSAPRAGWAEASPEEWQRAADAAVDECLGRCGRPRIAGVGLSGQMHGVVLCREDGAPLRPAVLWADTRSREEAERLRESPAELRRRLANPLVAGMAGPSLAWLVRKEPAGVEEAAWALQPKDWLRAALTGEVATEPSDASATLLWDVPADRWCDDAFALLGIPRRLAPAVRRSADVAGRVRQRAGCSIQPGTPVVHGGADTACALFGTATLPRGTIQISVGTGAQVVAAVESPQVDPSGTTHLFRSVMPNSWYAMGAVQNAGLAFERAWRWLGIGWEEAYRLAEEAPPGSAGLTFLPHLSGERTPYVDSTLRGGWLGLGLEHTRAHLVRAVLEGVAFAVRQAVDALREAGHPAAEARLVGGGSRHPSWQRMLADVLRLPLAVVAQPDASSQGAARLAAMGIGMPAQTPSPAVGMVIEPGSDFRYEEAFARFRARAPLRG
ncbi:MAG TPA: FGGY family carbohydrate kinase [Actinomycetota bacterium]|nr:FGGY family carbohydrate kinase [Actinomycetota bacterium]